MNLGLIPNSEEGWPVACAALKRSTGGWLHIHGNVSTYASSEVNSSAGGGVEREGERRGRGGAERNPWTMKEELSGKINRMSVRVTPIIVL